MLPVKTPMVDKQTDRNHELEIFFRLLRILAMYDRPTLLLRSLYVHCIFLSEGILHLLISWSWIKQQNETAFCDYRFDKYEWLLIFRTEFWLRFKNTNLFGLLKILDFRPVRLLRGDVWENQRDAPGCRPNLYSYSGHWKYSCIQGPWAIWFQLSMYHWGQGPLFWFLVKIVLSTGF